MTAKRTTRVAVVYHSVALYREGIFRRLFGRASNPEYTLISGRTSNQKSIRLLDPSLAQKPLENGGLRWTLIRNFWIGQILIQPAILLLPFQRKWDCVVFLGNAYYLTTWIAAALCRLTGKRVLMWTHGYRSRETGRTAAIKNRFFKLAHGLILYGERGREALIEQGFSPDRLYVAYNSLNHDRHLALREKLSGSPSPAVALFPEKRPVIVWAGRFAPGKELPLLMRALVRLKQEKLFVNCLLIGEGPEKEDMEFLAKELGLTDIVHFAGAIYDEEELATHLLGCDLAVSPGPVGVFAIHAMSFGLPVLTCNDWQRQGPEAEAIIPGKTGDFFEAGDAGSLAKRIREWVGSDQEHEKRRSACLEQVDRYYNPDYQEKIISLAVAGVSAQSIADSD